jgi:hypothetical protein
MTTFHKPLNTEKIEKLYAFMSIDENGFNGIVAEIIPGLGSVPMVVGSRRLADKLIPVAEKLTRDSGVKIGLFAFSRVDQLWQSEGAT